MNDTPLINTELEFLRDFFDAWESMHSIMETSASHQKQAMAAQNLVEAANRVRNFRKPVQGLVPNG